MPDREVCMSLDKECCPEVPLQVWWTEGEDLHPELGVTPGREGPETLPEGRTAGLDVFHEVQMDRNRRGKLRKLLRMKGSGPPPPSSVLADKHL